MVEEPTWGELLLDFFLMAAIPIAVGGTLILLLVGLTVWMTAPLRRRRRNGVAERSGQTVETSAPR
ncbi:hypothetical protein ACIRQH_14555 [Streptomyces sp. NPDC102279]|uniref:hypothetical protein n=1 Tax=Streptomyces sp. NPDC102279 TaxID=3366153 RepID=UPI00380A6783